MFFPKIEEFMSKDVVKINSSSRLSDALKTMNEHDIRDVVVCNNETQEISLLSINDLLRYYLVDGVLERPISELSISKLPLVDKNASILDVVKKFNHLDEYIGIVDENGVLEGITSYSDIADGIEPRLVLDRLTIGDLVKRHIPKIVGRGTTLQALYKLFSSPNDAVIVVGSPHKASAEMTSKNT